MKMKWWHYSIIVLAVMLLFVAVGLPYVATDEKSRKSEKDVRDEYTAAVDAHLSMLKPPVIIVGYREFSSESLVKVVDGDGKFFSFRDSYLVGQKVGGRLK